MVNMLQIPIRCFSCGGLVADKLEELESRTNNGENAKEVLDDLGVERYCCRRMLLSNTNIIDEILRYHEGLAQRKNEFVQD
mgnify:FL=1|tara:strand:+ start:411 stop:653 length:243 start_codon:yes stop_codon:yes gene_type:complete